MIGIGGRIRDCPRGAAARRTYSTPRRRARSFESGASGSLFCSLGGRLSSRRLTTDGVAEVLNPSLETFNFLRAHKSAANIASR